MIKFTRVAFRHKQPFSMRRLISDAIVCVLTAASMLATCVLAQGLDLTPQSAQIPARKPIAAASATSASTLKTASKPAWQDLTPSQQLSLKPLAAKWDTLGEAPKRKWIAIAANYPTLAPAEQIKLHSRMTEWVSLSQQQRNQARLNFAESKQLTPSQKTATWEAYQALSSEEKKKLAIAATPSPAGAAAATKPVPPKKLATVPLTRESPKQMPKISAANSAVNKNTLLPHSQPPVVPASAQK